MLQVQLLHLIFMFWTKNSSVLYQWGIYHQGIYYNIVLDLRFTSTWNMHMGNNQD